MTDTGMLLHTILQRSELLPLVFLRRIAQKSELDGGIHDLSTKDDATLSRSYSMDLSSSVYYLSSKNYVLNAHPRCYFCGNHNSETSSRERDPDLDPDPHDVKTMNLSMID